jgi:hypothetical protein
MIDLSIIACGMLMALMSRGSTLIDAKTEYDVVWAPLYLAVNGVFTMLITARILYVPGLQQSTLILIQMIVFFTGEHHLLLPALS